MKAGWESVKVGNVCDLATGGTPSRSKPEFFKDGEIRWLVSGDIHRGEIHDCEGRITELGMRNSSAKILPLNSVIIALNGQGKTRGSVALLRVEATCNQSLVSIAPRNHERLCPEFLYWNLHSRYREIRRITGDDDNDRRGLNMPLIKNISIPLPPLHEQRQIVAVLDKAFARIATAAANTQKSLSNARALFESALAAIFAEPGADWIVEPIAKNVRFIDYRGKTPPKRERGIRLITAKNVKMGFVRRTPEEFIDAAAYDEWMTRGFPKRGDVLFTTEAPLGNVAQLDTDEKVVIGQRLITMQAVSQKIDSTFLKYMLCSAPLQQAIHAHATGATVLGIKAKLLKTIPIFYPNTIAQQLQIVARLDRLYDEVESLSKLYQAKLQALIELKQSLQQKAFAGELT